MAKSLETIDDVGKRVRDFLDACIDQIERIATLGRTALYCMIGFGLGAMITGPVYGQLLHYAGADFMTWVGAMVGGAIGVLTARGEWKRTAARRRRRQAETARIGPPEQRPSLPMDTISNPLPVHRE